MSHACRYNKVNKEKSTEYFIPCFYVFIFVVKESENIVFSCF